MSGEGCGPGGGHRVVAIDGPAASGKSSAGRGVAERLGFAHLNSGLLYRAITWAALRGGWLEEGERFERELARLRLDLVREAGERDYRVLVDGRDPGAELGSREVSGSVSALSTRPSVRDRVVERLRGAAAREDLVCEGRDIGTVVFPGAGLKVFLTAAPEVRARRRLRDYGEPLSPARVRAETERIRERDDRDATRAVAPLRRAPDALEIDSSERTLGEVVEEIVELARDRFLCS